MFSKDCTSPCNEGDNRMLNTNTRKKFFSVKVVRHWNRLPREVMDDPVLAELRARLDRVMSNMVYWKVSLPMLGVLELNDL